MSLANKLIRIKWLQHLIFWVLSIYAIGAYFSISNHLEFIDFVYSFFFHLPLALLVYLNLQILIPRFLLKDRYGLFLLLAGLLLALAIALHELVFDIFIPALTSEFYLVSFTEWIVLAGIFTFYLFLSTLLKLSRSWYLLQEVDKERLQLELNSLKSQINPHFLFNSLNSIYALALKKDDSAPKSILELSGLMRYMIYEVSDEKVPLHKEVEALNHYIKLQGLRLSEQAEIDIQIQMEDENRAIAPLLFLPLIENSFKHGLKAKRGNFVKVKLQSDPRSLRLDIRNNKSPSVEMEKAEYGGIGLENVRKRLALIYGDKGSLKISNQQDLFQVQLKIQWHD